MTEKPGRSPIAVLFALGVESGCLEDRLKQKKVFRASGFTLCEGILRDQEVLVARTGAGADATRQAAEAILLGHHPRYVISAGFAGSLSPELKKQDRFFPVECCDERVRIETLDPLPDSFPQKNDQRGRLLTFSRPISTPPERESLGKLFHADAVDMETFALAEWCHSRGTPLYSVRVISDDFDQTLPDDILKLMEQTTMLSQWGAAAKLAWNRPGSVFDMYRLREDALVASLSLADAVEDFLKG